LKTNNWFDDQLRAAIKAYDARMNIRQAALKYNISYITFWEHFLAIEGAQIMGQKIF